MTSRSETNLAKHLAVGSGADDSESVEVGFIAQFKSQPNLFVNLNKMGAKSLQKQWLDWKWRQSVAPNGAQVVVAQGSTKLDGGSASPSSVGYYGYDNDTLNAAGQPQMVPTPTTPTEAKKEGRDASATLDAANGGFGKNEDDNEITGILVSNGDPGPTGILGAKSPKPFKAGWRWFYTQQHGDNPTYEVIPAEDDEPDGS